MSKGRTKEDNCNAIARILKDFCSCSENAAWSPDMTADRKGPFLKSELTNMSGMRRRILTLAKRRNKEVITEPPKFKEDKTLNINLINAPTQNSNIQRNIGSFLNSRRLCEDDEDIYETPIQVSESYGENWSLSKSWNNRYFYNRSGERLLDRPFLLERIDEIPKKKKDRIQKEQLRYERNIKRHIRIRVMLSLRMRRYAKKRLKKQRQPVTSSSIPPRKFPRSTSTSSSFGTRSFSSTTKERVRDGTVLFDIHEARNSMLELCHDYEEELDTLDIALRAGNFRCVSRGFTHGAAHRRGRRRR